MTEQAAKASANDDAVGLKYVKASEHENGPPESVPVHTATDPAPPTSAVATDWAEPGDQVNDGAAKGMNGDHAASVKDAAAYKVAGPAEVDEQHDSPPSEVAATAGQDVLAAVSSSSSPSGVVPPASPASGDTGMVVASAGEEQAPASAAAAAPQPTAENTGADIAKDEPAETRNGSAEPAAGDTPAEDSGAAAAAAPAVRETYTSAETAGVQDDGIQPQQQGSSGRGKELQQVSGGELKEQDSQPQQSSCDKVIEEAAKQGSPLEETPSKPQAVKASESKATVEKEAQLTPEPVKDSEAEASTASPDAGGCPPADASKPTPFASPPGTVQAITRRLSSNALASTPPLKPTTSDKQLGSSVGAVVTPVAAVAGRASKSPSHKSGEASPMSTHDTKNTINVSQLLKVGAFKLQPLRDFVSYDELQRLRVEDGIDATRKEDYLSDEDFHQVFGMERDAFKKLPAWRQAQAKKKANLF